MRSQHQSHGGIDPGNFFDDNRKAQGVEARAAVPFGNHDAEEAQLGHLRQQFPGKPRRFIALSRPRRNLALGELEHGLFKQLMLLAQIKVHGASPQYSSRGSAL